MLTTDQFRARTKGVTRRLGWWNVKPGEILCGVEKGQGLKKGEKIVRLGLIRVRDARPEPLNAITKSDCALEGFPDLTPAQFVTMFCHHNRCEPETEVNRIVFDYVIRQQGDSVFVVAATPAGETPPACPVAVGDFAQIVDHVDLPRYLVKMIGRIGKVDYLYTTRYPPRMSITTSILTNQETPSMRWLAVMEMPTKSKLKIKRTVPVVALDRMVD